MEEQDIPEADLIDDALEKIINEIIGEEGDIEEFDAASDVILDLMEQLAMEEVITDPPDFEASAEAKQEWLDRFLPVIEQEVHKALHDGFLGNEPEDI